MQSVPALQLPLSLLTEHRGMLLLEESMRLGVTALQSDSRAVRANALQARPA